MKTCTKCKEAKQNNEFGINSSRPDGLNCWCKVCAKGSDAKYRAENKAKVKESAEKWREANYEKKKASDTRYRAENAEKVKKSHEAYRLANPTKFNANKAAWNKANQDKRRIIEHNYRARKSGGKLSAGLASKLFRLQKGRCPCCGLLLGKNFHLDHIVPLALGGPNIDSNIQLLRSTCNTNKHAKDPVIFMQQRGFLL